jgi:serine/threonine protein kinase
MRFTTSIRGSQGYYAPEFLFDDHPSYNNKVDIWSLGCILYEFAVGKRAFHTEWVTREYKIKGILPELSLDEYFGEEEKQTVQNALTRMLNFVPNARPRAAQLVEEFGTNCQKTMMERPENVRIYQNFQYSGPSVRQLPPDSGKEESLNDKMIVAEQVQNVDNGLESQTLIAGAPLPAALVEEESPNNDVAMTPAQVQSIQNHQVVDEHIELHAR